MIFKLLKTTSFKLTLIAAALFSSCVLALMGLLYVHMQRTIETQLQQRINAEVEQLRIDYQQDGLDELRHDIRERVEANTYGRLLYSIQGPDGRVIFDPISLMPDKDGWNQIKTSHTTLLVYTVSLSDGYRFAVASDMHEINTLRRAMLNRVGAALGIILVLSLLVGLFVSRIFLRQVDKIARTAWAIGEGHIDQRLPVRGTGDDLDRLTLIINQMLDRIEELVDDVRQVSNNIAHDLRTPLGHLRQTLEVLKEKSDVESTVMAEEAIRQLDAVLETFAALLRIAEIESGTRRAGFARTDLSVLLQQLTESYQSVAEENGQSLLADIMPNVEIFGDKHLLTQLFVNLIENAICYAGASATIKITVTQTVESLSISVSDTGTGISATERKQVLKPFYRIEKSRTSKGTGLGLSLVEAVAKLHEFKLSLSDNNPGLIVTLSKKLHNA